MSHMRSGAELLKWAREKAQAAAKIDTGLGAPGSWDGITEAIARAYVLGGIDALKDETDWKRKQRESSGREPPAPPLTDRV